MIIKLVLIKGTLEMVTVRAMGRAGAFCPTWWVCPWVAVASRITEGKLTITTSSLFQLHDSFIHPFS